MRITVPPHTSALPRGAVSSLAAVGQRYPGRRRTHFLKSCILRCINQVRRPRTPWGPPHTRCMGYIWMLAGGVHIREKKERRPDCQPSSHKDTTREQPEWGAEKDVSLLPLHFPVAVDTQFRAQAQGQPPRKPQRPAWRKSRRCAVKTQ